MNKQKLKVLKNMQKRLDKYAKEEKNQDVKYQLFQAAGFLEELFWMGE